MEPKILKDFYLLVIKPDRGTYYAHAHYFEFAIIGAALFDLHREGILTIAEKRLYASSSSNTGFLAFDRIIEVVNRGSASRIGTIIGKVKFRFRSFKKSIVSHLIDQKEIYPVKKHFLFIPYYRYFPKNRDGRMDSVRRVRDILLRNEDPKPDDMYILSLISASQIIRAFSDVRKERWQMRRKLKEILANGSRFHPNYPDMSLITKGIRLAITASNAAYSAAH